MTPERRVKAAADNLALIRADYEAGLCSKRKVAHKHGISTVTLWRYATEGKWVYGKDRDHLMDMHSHQAYERLMGMRAEVIEEHAIELAKLRESLHKAETPSELNHLQRLVNEFLKLIRAERTSLGLPDRYYPAS